MAIAIIVLEFVSAVVSWIDTWRSNMLKPSERPVEKIAYTRAEAAQATGVSFNCIADAVSSGDLPSIRKGRQWIILATDLLDWLKR